MDHSDAQRIAFIKAFVSFRKECHDSRSQEELEIVGRQLIIGCQEHYRSAVTRVANISAVVPPDKQDYFKKLALELCTIDSVSDFKDLVDSIVSEFPLVTAWLSWWRHKDRAPIIFPAVREMSEEAWNSMPNTTNAAESQHQKIYTAVGRNLEFFQALDGLYAVEDMYRRQWLAAHGI